MAIQRRMHVVSSAEVIPVETALKVAFATTNMETVDQHFGSSKGFAIYAIDPEKFSLLEVAEFGAQNPDVEEDKLQEKIEMLAGCAAVFSQAIGASAIRQLVAVGVQPLKVSEGSPIKELLQSLQEQMRQGPSAWLVKAIERQKGPAFNEFGGLESELWDE